MNTTELTKVTPVGHVAATAPSSTRVFARHGIDFCCGGGVRSVTDDYTPPEGACNTWRALWHALADLERSLHEHIHLENHILFPGALRA